jgi:hypothetical protein
MREEIRELIAAHPFMPFTIFFSDGMQLEVKHPDQIMLTDSRVHVAEGSKVHRIALLHATRVAVNEPVS